MADEWVAGLEHRPGYNSGWRAGRIVARVLRMHFTAGSESTGVGDQGYFKFLVHDDPGRVPSQFSEMTALDWDACEWNPYGLGIEMERRSWDQPLTGEQIGWAGYIVGKVHEFFNGSIPLTLHRAPRLWITDDYTGWANHEGLEERACDQHYDGVTDDEWNAILTAAGLAQGGDTMPTMNAVLCVNAYGLVYVYDPNAHTKTWIRSQAALDSYKALRAISGLPSDVVRNATTDNLLADAREINDIPSPFPTGGGGSGGATKAEVAAIVTADGALTRTEVAKPRNLVGQVG